MTRERSLDDSKLQELHRSVQHDPKYESLVEDTEQSNLYVLAGARSVHYVFVDPDSKEVKFLEHDLDSGPDLESAREYAGEPSLLDEADVLDRYDAEELHELWSTLAAAHASRGEEPEPVRRDVASDGGRDARRESLARRPADVRAQANEAREVGAVQKSAAGVNADTTHAAKGKAKKAERNEREPEAMTEKTVKKDPAPAGKPARPAKKRSSSPPRAPSPPAARRLHTKEETPHYLIPRMGELPVSNAVRYRTAHLLEDWGSSELKIYEPKQPDPSDLDGRIPLEGVLLTHEQRWIARGMSLGSLLHSLALAPGEVTRVAMMDWRRRERGAASEVTRQDDTVSAQDHRNRAVSEIQAATMHEVQLGQSQATSSGSSGEAGFSLPIFSSGGSVNHSTALSTNYTDGSRNVGMSANQNINEATSRHAQAARARRASVVREVSQEESAQLSTRVVANYNHAHALSMLYFEVVEVYELETRVVDAERLIYLPMQLPEGILLEESLLGVADQLAAAAEHRGDLRLAAAIRGWKAKQTGLGPTEDEFQEAADKAKAAAQRADDELAAATAAAAAASKDAQAAKKAADEARARAIVPFAPSDWGAADRGAMAKAETAKREADASAVAKAHAATAAKRAHEALAAAKAELAAHKADMDKITSAISQDALYYMQAIWLGRDRATVQSELRDYKWPEDAKRALSTCVDPTPVTVSGTSVGYRWHFESTEEREKFVAEHIGSKAVTETIAVPTGGVFGEAVLGEAVAAEKIDLTRFWKWQDSPIPILPPDIAPLSAESRARQMDTSTGKLAETAAKLDPLQALPDPSGLGAIGEIMKSQVFRDMSGQDVVKELALAAGQHAADGAQDAAHVASQNLQSTMDFLHKMASLATQDTTTMGGLQADDGPGEGEGAGEEGAGGEGDGEDSGGGGVLDEVENVAEEGVEDAVENPELFL